MTGVFEHFPYLPSIRGCFILREENEGAVDKEERDERVKGTTRAILMNL